ncbi:LOW QUALITY PROTEIN: glycogen synthase kinase-3 alpha [Drosophila eugracilis]|uniref:LOW QUALITY PROTEIN: glycogen synthase kinase-3 alpha n=1 Tax=Drosophila eugracilis TaxID=29029 RepID=UPI001BD9617D|nr:LOW QUALITY PROTEIN: glycogen synthase kinase-3 alpha [Drosophila eugracilis]
MENKENRQKSRKRQSQRQEQVPLIIPNDSVVSTYAIGLRSSDPNPAKIEIKELIGSGSFGQVYKAQLDDSEEMVAVKQTLYNPKVCQREAEIMEQLVEHSCIIRLIMHSVVTLGDPPMNYIMLVMEWMPMTLLDYIRDHLPQLGHPELLIYARILSFQIFRGLGYIHSLGICHRDIKPENLLMDHQKMVLKISDFGSAKFMVPEEPSLSYICSRLYRAPELFAKYEHYSCAIDIWSAGCVLAELLKGSPLFASQKHDRKQLKLIINMLGSNGLERAPEIRTKCGESVRLMTNRPCWDQLLNVAVPQDFSDLLNSCLIYEFSARISPLEACSHRSYDQLRVMNTLELRMPNGYPLPPLFNFTIHEIGGDPKIWIDLLPLHIAQDVEMPAVAAFKNV